MRYDAAYFRPHVWNRMLLCKPHRRFKKVSPKTSGGLAHLCRFVTSSTGHGVYCMMLRFSIKPIDAKITPHKQCSPEINSVPASKLSKEVNDTSMRPKSQSDVLVPKPCHKCDWRPVLVGYDPLTSPFLKAGSARRSGSAMNGSPP